MLTQVVRHERACALGMKPRAYSSVTEDYRPLDEANCDIGSPLFQVP